MALRAVGRWLLGGSLVLVGTAHLTVARDAFRAQVPDWLPGENVIIVASGVVEIAFGLSLVLLTRHRVLVGWLVAAFFLAVLPGNISQLVTHTDAFGLDTDRARAVRLFFQPVLVAWALWCTGAWEAYRHWRGRRRVRMLDR
ncbi:MAG: hypothetical protein WB508_01865 [Aeromicrobium sp.]